MQGIRTEQNQQETTSHCNTYAVQQLQPFWYIYKIILINYFYISHHHLNISILSTKFASDLSNPILYGIPLGVAHRPQSLNISDWFYDPDNLTDVMNCIMTLLSDHPCRLPHLIRTNINEPERPVWGYFLKAGLTQLSTSYYCYRQKAQSWSSSSEGFSFTTMHSNPSRYN